MKKIMKMLSLAVFAALVLCGCGDNALAYVEKDAEWIVYGNTKELFKSKIWDAIEEHDLLDELAEQLKKEVGLEDLEDLDGNIAFWGSFGPKQHPVPEVDAAVLVLKKNIAKELFDAEEDKLTEKIKEENKNAEYYRSILETETIDGCKALVYKIQHKNMDTGTWGNEKILYTIVLADKNILQVYPEKEPSALAKPANKNNLAGMIDKNAIAAAAVCGDIVRTGLKQRLGGDAPHIGDIVLQIRADRKTLSVEGSVDISRIDD